MLLQHGASVEVERVEGLYKWKVQGVSFAAVLSTATVAVHTNKGKLSRR